MIVNSATNKDNRTNPRTTFGSTPSQPPVRRQTSTQQLESSLPPDATLVERAIVGFLSFMSALSDSKK